MEWYLVAVNCIVNNCVKDVGNKQWNHSTKSIGGEMRPRNQYTPIEGGAWKNIIQQGRIKALGYVNLVQRPIQNGKGNETS